MCICGSCHNAEDALWVSQVAGPADGDRDGQQAAGDAPRGRRDASRGESAPEGAVGAAGEAVFRRPHQHPVHLGNRRRSVMKRQETKEWSRWNQVVFALFQGTTGNPKGATLSHHNIINNAYFFGLRMRYDIRVSLSSCLHQAAKTALEKFLLFFFFPSFILLLA